MLALAALVLPSIAVHHSVTADSQVAQAANVTPAPPITSTATPAAASRPTSTAVPAATAKPPAPTVTTTLASAVTPVPEQLPPGHNVVLIVLDAGKPSYLGLAQYPHIAALIKSGTVYDRAWVGEMESSTPGVHVTFGTGTLPRENGFLGFGWATPQSRVKVDFRTLLANGQIDPVLKSLPTPSVAARLHEAIPGAVSVAASGHKDYAVVGLGGGAADYELYGKFLTNNKGFIPTFMHAPPPLTSAELKSLTVKGTMHIGAEDTWAFKYASLVASHVKPRLMMINVPEVDTWGHWYGPSDDKVFKSLMQGVDNGLGLLEDTYRKLGILGNTDFIITADHSMMESRPAKNWHSLWVAAGLVHAQVVRADGEGGAVWLKNPAQAEAVAQKLSAMRPQHVQAIFYRSATGDNYHYLRASPDNWLVSTQAASALQHLVDTTAGHDGPDLWVLYRENYTVVPRNVAGTWKGTHGGATWKVQHVPLIMSGPDIRSGVHSTFPARAIDIAPTMERLLGLPYMARDGVTLADALQDASTDEVHRQQAVAASVTADVLALQQQSLADQKESPRWPKITHPVFRCTVGKSAPNIPGCIITPAISSNG